MTDIYDHSKPMKKSKAYAAVSFIIGGQSLLTIIDKIFHHSRRRLYNPEFSPAALSSFEPIMMDHIRLFCDQLVRKTPYDHDGWTQARNVKDLCRLHRGIGLAPTNCSLAGNRVAFDIGGDFVFGQKFRTLVTEENRYLINAIVALNIRSGMHAQCPKLARFYLELLWPPLDLQTFRKCHEWRRSIGEKLKGQEKATHGLFFKTLGGEDPETGKDISYNELLAEAQFLQVAGKFWSCHSIQKALLTVAD